MECSCEAGEIVLSYIMRSNQKRGIYLSEVVFRDPIHGFINVDQLELKIINSMPFQRLRHIKQLGTSYLVYHGAEHTRFGHSLGVMHLISQHIKSMLECEEEPQ